MTEGNYSNVGHRGPVYKGLGAMNPCDNLALYSVDCQVICNQRYESTIKTPRLNETSRYGNMPERDKKKHKAIQHLFIPLVSRVCRYIKNTTSPHLPVIVMGT
jgi:hypothetical protein